MATLTFAAPMAGGTYEFRFYASGGWTRLATSAPVVIVAPSPPAGPALLVNGSATPITVAAGSVLTIAASGGPANPGDWVTLVPAGAPATGTYQFMNGQATPPLAGAANATLAFAAPATPGTYEFRFFENAGWTRLAASTTVVVQ